MAFDRYRGGAQRRHFQLRSQSRQLAPDAPPRRALSAAHQSVLPRSLYARSQSEPLAASRERGEAPGHFSKTFIPAAFKISGNKPVSPSKASYCRCERDAS
jgi:hypothetical protein